MNDAAPRFSAIPVEVIPVEAATHVASPPRARVSDAPLPPETTPEATPRTSGAPSHRPDYLDGFLAAPPADLAPEAPGGALYEAVIAALRDIFDPEIPVNIYDLGLIYGVEITPDASVAVTMTLTTPHCPVAESMPGEVELRVASVPGVRDCEVNLVWDPPWIPAHMSDDARLELGML